MTGSISDVPDSVINEVLAQLGARLDHEDPVGEMVIWFMLDFPTFIQVEGYNTGTYQSLKACIERVRRHIAEVAEHYLDAEDARVLVTHYQYKQALLWRIDQSLRQLVRQSG